METLRKARSTYRGAFTKTYKKLCDTENFEEKQVCFELLSKHFSRIEEYDQKIFELLLDDDADEDTLTDEQMKRDEYQSTFIKAKLCFTRASEEYRDTSASEVNRSTVHRKDHRYKLPYIELAKFDGELKGWLSFWSQFQKIHNDPDLSNEDKFHYLTQSMIPGSRASDVVNSYPPIAENYSKAIESLETRFGNKDLLVEVYVRDLIQLVISNMNNATSKNFHVSVLYDKLESHMRALESLNVSKEACTPILYPLVESSLPEELLRVWQRYRNTTGIDPKQRLEKLMNFLKLEAESDQSISMAVRGFSLNKEKDVKKSVKGNDSDTDRLPTATNLLVPKAEICCLFCNGKHESYKCLKARKQSVEERHQAIKGKACTRCLKTGHSYWKCWSKVKCEDCGKRHVTIMCRGTQNKASTPTQDTVKSFVGISLNQDVYLQTLRIELNFEGKSKVVRAVLDTGSQYSYILEDLAADMKYVCIGKHNMKHGLFGGATSLPETHNKFSIKVKNLLSSNSCHIDVFSKNIICTSIPTISDKIYKQLIEDHNISLTDIGKMEPISILIGADMLPRLLTSNITYLSNDIVAMETHLGWTLMGRRNDQATREHDTAMVVISLYVHQASVADLWKLDTLGITDPIEKETREMHLREVEDYFVNTTTVNEEGRYEIALPWKQNHPPLVKNRELCFRRLLKVTEKLKSDNYFDAYNKVFVDWLNEGIIEKVTESEYDEFSFYLPHRPVIKLSSSTTPIRPVFDASAHVKDSPSLNQCLETGPNLIELIPSMILRFREKRLGFIADIRKAFLMISIRPSDRDFVRFLWWSNNDCNTLQIYRHARVVFGLTSSPFLLGATIKLHLERALKSAVNMSIESYVIGKLLKSFYVDNCVCCVDDEDSFNIFRDTAIHVMASGGFDLRCWEHTGQKDSTQQASVLGMAWDKTNDTLSLKDIPQDTLPNVITKRVILSFSHRIFDCLGMVCPVLVYPKLLLRKLSTHYDWDTPVSEEDRKTFTEWYLQLKYLKDIKIPRWMFVSHIDKSNVSFHVFVDASLAAYAAVVFARIEYADCVILRFIQAKSRVAPTTTTTIPRLELLAATIGARLMKSIVEALGYEGIYSTYYWSDSSIVLSWIKRNWQWRVFVQNRVKEIRSLSTADQWRFVPGDLNPADLPSRGCDAQCFIKSGWLDGPGWLRLKPGSWPMPSECIVDEDAVLKERKQGDRSEATEGLSLITQSSTFEPSCWYTHHFSNYNKIVRMIGWIKRFIANSRSGNFVRTRSNTRQDLSNEEFQAATIVLLRLAQRDMFSGPDDPKLLSFDTQLDDEKLIRIKTPVAAKVDEFAFRFPIVLDSKHELVTRIIQYEHTRNQHAGTETLLSLLRERYWILRGRQAVRKIVNACIICKRHRVKNLQEITPSLPENRVNTVGVFQVIGVDYAGPLHLKDKKKVWICLFTCAVYRAVHLELATTLSADNFLQAFRRFAARRGVPSVVYSDNGTNFVSASKFLPDIEWHFNVPSAPWWGGFFERMVRIVKDLLRKVLRRSSVNYEEMLTVLYECEGIVNSRPITYLSENPLERSPLTPSCFLHFMKDDIKHDLHTVREHDIGRSYRRVWQIKESLKKRFRDEYLGSLQNHPSRINRIGELKIGDVVLVGNDDKRIHWPLAKVLELIPGRDGKIRVVKVGTARGVLTRPIQRIYPLELSAGGGC